jgi:hypothetical protein
MTTPDIRPFIRADKPETHKVVLMLSRLPGDMVTVRLMDTRNGKFKTREVKECKSLRYATHATTFDWGNNLGGSKQLALAVCLELYPVSVAIKYHLEFHKYFIFPIPRTHPFPSHVNVKKSVFPVELYVPINPNV